MNLRFEGVSFTYPGGVAALREIDLALGAGEAVAVIGENGAGKTTLVKHLNGLLRPRAGKVWVGEWDAGRHSIARLARRVGFVFQNPDEQLFERRVRDEVAFGPRNLGFAPEAVERAVAGALARVGLEAEAESHPYDLPPARRRWVALAATLAMETPVLVLDEPTTGFDARGVERLGRLVDGLRDEGRTIIAVTHDLEFCADHFRRVVVMAGGRVIDDGPAAAVLAHGEVLERAAVEPPQLVRLAQALGLPEATADEERFLELLRARAREKRP